jgi:hypothetical protein
MLPTTDWRERTAFLPKQTRYVFSLDLRLAFDQTSLSGLGPDVRVRAGTPRAEDLAAALAGRSQASPGRGTEPEHLAVADTYHVLNEELTTTVDGAVHELPLAQVVDVQDWLTVEESGVVGLSGRARLLTDDWASISMLYGGVVRLGFAGARSLISERGEARGGAQVATRYEVDRPRYRWLSQAQLVGFGEATLVPVPGRNTKILTLSLDLYSAL